MGSWSLASPRWRSCSATRSSAAASVDTLPEFGPTYVEVQTEALGLSAEEVEQLITVPLEADLLNGVPFLDEIHSQSVAGPVLDRHVLRPGTDVLRARQVVAERLTQAHALPQRLQVAGRCSNRSRRPAGS